jgi:chloramphenicol 3-O phosphotransferase
MSEPGAGRIILLNGATSSGKSSIARVLQATIEAPFMHWSIDHLREAGALPLERIRSGEFAWPSHREAFFEGFHRSLSAFAGAGNDLIVEHIVETPAWMARLVELLDGFDVFFVGVRCPLDELERREAARGDRPQGGARRDFETIHGPATYDLEVDGRRPPEETAREILATWRERTWPGAFPRLATQTVAKSPH